MSDSGRPTQPPNTGRHQRARFQTTLRMGGSKRRTTKEDHGEATAPDECEALRSRVAQLEDELKSERALALGSAEGVRDALRQEKDAQAALEAERRKASASEGRTSALQSKLSVAAAENDSLREDVRVAERRIASLQATCRVKDAELDELRANPRSRGGGKAERSEPARAQAAEITRERDALARELSAAARERDALEREVAALRESLDEANGRADRDDERALSMAAALSRASELLSELERDEASAGTRRARTIGDLRECLQSPDADRTGERPKAGEV